MHSLLLCGFYPFCRGSFFFIRSKYFFEHLSCFTALTCSIFSFVPSLLISVSSYISTAHLFHQFCFCQEISKLHQKASLLSYIPYILCISWSLSHTMCLANSKGVFCRIWPASVRTTGVRSCFAASRDSVRSVSYRKDGWTRVFSCSGGTLLPVVKPPKASKL